MVKTISAIAGIGTIGASFEIDEAERQQAGSLATGANMPVQALDRLLVEIAMPDIEVAAAALASVADVPRVRIDFAPADAGRPSVMAPNLPTDSQFGGQFYIRNTMGGQFDLRLFNGDISVWDEFTGAGVRIGIIDDGIDYNHGDLDDSYDASLETVDGFHTTLDAAHGTAVAGIIAAERNGAGTVGVAYGSQITMMGAINGASSNISIVDSLVNSLNFDVINNSWGYTTPWYDQFFNGDQADAYSALNDLASNGRGGLGTIFVKAAGNGRDDYNDNANFSFFNGHGASITVGAVDRDGYVSYYSTEGSSLLVSAFGTPGEVLTTDRLGTDGYSATDYTDGFNGTSAATPMVTGIVALMLDANPNLGFRDVREILALTARHVGSAMGGGPSFNEHYQWGWNASDSWNGGGQHFSEDYGFGLVDALAAVRLAESWTETKTTANLTLADASVVVVDGTIADESTLTVSFTIAPGVTIEHVGLDLDMSHTFTGDLVIRLVSPGNTTSYLLKNNGQYVSGSTLYSWSLPSYSGNDITLASTAFFGEASGGEWKLIIDDVANGDSGYLTSFDFYALGSSSADDTYVFTNEYSDYATTARQAPADTDGGYDIVNASAVSSASVIDLGGGGSTIDGVTLAFSGAIEEASGGDGNDRLIGSSAANTLKGWRGNDVLIGGNGADTMDGGVGRDVGDYSLKSFKVDVTLNGATNVIVSVNGAAEDTIRNIEAVYGGTVGDKLTGDGLANIFRGNGGVDTIDGGAGADFADFSDKTLKVEVVLTGSTATIVKVNGVNEDSIKNIEHLVGGSNGDSLTGDSIANSFVSGAGNDTLKGAGGNDTLDGGVNADTADYSDKTQKVEVALNTATTVIVKVNGVNEDSIKNIEHLIGGSAGDKLTGDGLGNIFRGNAGVDTLDGGAGADTADYSEKTTRVEVALNTATAVNVLVNGVAEDFIKNIEHVIGGSAGDKLTGDGAANSFMGNAGNDAFKGAGGADMLDGGANTDTADYSDKTAKVEVALNGATAVLVKIGAANEDSIKNVEHIIGGTIGDKLTGDALANLFRGNGGADTLDGGAASDTADYAEKTVKVEVALNASTAVIVKVNNANEDSIKNIENINGGTIGDKLTGDGLANIFRGNGGADTLDGAGGSDTADYAEKTTKVEVILNGATAVAVKINGANEDSIKNIENVNGGSAGDKITGDGLANVFAGNGGNDTLLGGNGNDMLDGGTGMDTFDGGANADQYRFTTALGATNVDTISVFEINSDKIGLSKAIFGALGVNAGGLGPLAAGAFHAAAGAVAGAALDDRIIYNTSNGRLYLDKDGNQAGGVAAVHFATLTNKPLGLDNLDFVIV